MHRIAGKGAGALMGIAALWSCAHGGNKPEAQQMERIDNSSLTHLNEQQMQPVDDARIEDGRARDALARAKANETEARTRVEVAKAEKDVSVAQLNRAKAEHDLLVQQKAAPAEQARAAQARKDAEDRVRASDLKIDYLGKMVEVAGKETALADAHAQVTTALVERAKYHALQAGDPNQLQGVDAAKIDAQVAELQVKESNARREAADKRVAAVDSYNRWQELDAKVRTAAAPPSEKLTPPVASQPSQQPINKVAPAQQQPPQPPVSSQPDR